MTEAAATVTLKAYQDEFRYNRQAAADHDGGSGCDLRISCSKPELAGLQPRSGPITALRPFASSHPSHSRRFPIWNLGSVLYSTLRMLYHTLAI